ncbi:MAG TPA: cytidine deaminase [Candidatus Merdivicinus intestinigallinarum]|nr:cytidine deaminase [Candidatus Merdivicinus intestinigallinarum]
MEEMRIKLARAALDARQKAYCPYSHFAVGAAVLVKSGKIYTGCNIENATQGPGVCAERAALYKAVSEGEREFLAIAIAGGPEGREPDGFCPPCGVCRQALAEFCAGEMPVILVKNPEETQVYRLEELFPLAFSMR